MFPDRCEPGDAGVALMTPPRNLRAPPLHGRINQEFAMAEPLDYFTPRRGDEPHRPDRRDGPAAPIPIELDVVVTQTPDHAAARAVEVEFERQRIAFFRTERGDAVNRLVELHVRSADEARAAQAAATIFARRKRLNQLSPRRPPAPDLTSAPHLPDFPLLP
jgi:hypothetical protein